MKPAPIALLAVVAAAAAGCGGSHPRVVKGAPPPPSRAELSKLARVALGRSGKLLEVTR